MPILINIQTVLSYVFIGLTLATLTAALIIRLFKLRHVADIMELFATGFFVLYTAEMWIAFGYSMFNVLLLSLAVVLAVYKIIFFIRGK